MLSLGTSSMLFIGIVVVSGVLVGSQEWDPFQLVFLSFYFTGYTVYFVTLHFKRGIEKEERQNRKIKKRKNYIFWKCGELFQHCSSWLAKSEWVKEWFYSTYLLLKLHLTFIQVDNTIIIDWDWGAHRVTTNLSGLKKDFV